MQRTALDNAAVPVIASLLVGIAFVIALSFVVASLPPKISTTSDGQLFYSSPSEIIKVADDAGNCCDEMTVLTFGNESIDNYAGGVVVPDDVS